MRTIQRDTSPSAALFKGTERGLVSGTQPKTGLRQHKGSGLFLLCFTVVSKPGACQLVYPTCLGRQSPLQSGACFTHGVTHWQRYSPGSWCVSGSWCLSCTCAGVACSAYPNVPGKQQFVRFHDPCMESWVLQGTTLAPPHLQLTPQLDWCLLDWCFSSASEVEGINNYCSKVPATVTQEILRNYVWVLKSVFSLTHGACSTCPFAVTSIFPWIFPPHAQSSKLAPCSTTTSQSKELLRSWD